MEDVWKRAASWKKPQDFGGELQSIASQETASPIAISNMAPPVPDRA